MATHQISIIGHGTVPDDSGDVFFQPYSVIDTGSPAVDPLVVVFENTATRDGLRGEFVVPQNYVGSAVFTVHWTANATSGDVEWDIDYLTRTAGEDMGAAITRSINQNDTKTGTAFVLETIDLSATDGDFAAGDIVTLELFRDGTDGGDTMAADAMVFDLLFEYADA